MSYNIFWADKKALKSFDGLPTVIRGRLKPVIFLLSKDPRPAGVKRLSRRLEGVWPIRVGDWRILYDIDDKLHKVFLLDVGPRKSIYR